MWNLVMGALVSSEDEREQDINNPRPDSQSSSQHINNMKVLSSGSIQRPSQDTPMVHSSREPSPDVPERQQGDGMEVPTTSKPQQETKTIPASMVQTPETKVKTSKPPPIADRIDLTPNLPSSPLVLEKPKLFPKGTYPPSVKKHREAKFVPYEPYKGAVKPFIQTKLNRKSSERRIVSSPEKSFNQVETEPKLVEDEVDSTAPESSMNPELEENYRTMLKAKENELERMRVALENSEKQLKIQTQVNCEVKRLLVASVGEDIEARVDFLTQDKARLAADVLQYNNKISRDWEEKEALSVESDIWRSKFLACTLILEEVSRSKQYSESRCNQIEHAARRVLLERNQLKTSLATTQSIISKLNLSFDPLSRSETVTRSEDILQQAESLNRTCQALCDRLVGESKPLAGDITETHTSLDSPAEKELRRLLATMSCAESRLPEQASSTLTKGARTLLLKMGDKAQSTGQGEFSTCSHCNGSVHVV